MTVREHTGANWEAQSILSGRTGNWRSLALAYAACSGGGRHLSIFHIFALFSDSKHFRALTPVKSYEDFRAALFGTSLACWRCVLFELFAKKPRDYLTARTYVWRTTPARHSRSQGQLSEVQWNRETIQWILMAGSLPDSQLRSHSLFYSVADNNKRSA